MAVSPSPPPNLESNLQKPEPDKTLVSPLQSDPATLPTLSSSSPSPSPAFIPENPNPNPNPNHNHNHNHNYNPNHNSNPPLMSYPPPSIQSFPPSAPSFRPSVPNILYSPFPPNPNFQNQGIQPPGVAGSPVSIMINGVSTGAGAVSVSVPHMGPAGMYHSAPGRPYGQLPNGFAPGMIHSVPPPGIPGYPSPYAGLVRPPVFPPRPLGAIGVVPPLTRPLVPGIRGTPPIVTPVIRPAVPIVALPEKPQTTIYVGKIAPTVENDFLLSLLRLCGPVKSWKRAQDPSDGSPRGFGFCEFESAEGVLRALRLLSKFNVDGQELVLNVNQATREYLERYVEKKTEREKKLKEGEAEGANLEEETAPGAEKPNPPKTLEDFKNDTNEDKEHPDPQKFGIVTDEDREADKDALEKLTNMMEERLKNRPPPPPPAQTLADSSAKSNSEAPSKLKEADSDLDITKSDVAEDKNDDETMSENKSAGEHDKLETGSSDKSRPYERRGRERDRERDLKREKERELERYERERERERVRRERDREMKIREAERQYKERVKEWESRERDKEYQRLHEKEREKEKERERRREIKDQEDESDDEDTRKRRRRSSTYEEKRRKRQREKDEDMADSVREEEEIAEAKQRAAEEKQQELVTNNAIHEPMVLDEVIGADGRESVEEETCGSDFAHHAGEDAIVRNMNDDELRIESSSVSDMAQNSNNPARKLGFGLVGSGKRTAVPSVFHEDDEEDGDKEKKMRPLVPIDYTTDEVQAIQGSESGGTPLNLAAAAEFAKRISHGNPKEERAESERERSRRSNDRLSQRERDRDGDESNRSRDENRDKVNDKSSENKKLLDAKQLIDMIPKTKEELFSYKINWAVYDKHELHERMRPWISKKITEFLGEEEATLVDYIVSSTKEHVKASQMLELLQSILDDEAEMFVLKMWRMLIFEIKKVETGLSLKPKA